MYVAYTTVVGMIITYTQAIVNAFIHVFEENIMWGN